MTPGEGLGGGAILHGVASKVLSDTGAFEWIPEGSQGERGGLVGEDPSRQRDQIAQRPRGGHLRGPVCLAYLGDCEEASGEGTEVSDVGKGQKGQARARQTFSTNGQVVNILGFVGQTVSVATTQLCPCSSKAP